MADVHAMKFLLLLIIAGQPERVALQCNTYRECDRAGAAVTQAYIEQYHVMPSAVSYRVILGTRKYLYE